MSHSVVTLARLQGLRDRLADGAGQRYLLMTRSGLSVGRGTRFHGMPLITLADPTAAVCLGDRVSLISRSRDTALGVAHRVVIRAMAPGAVIGIGSDTGISGGTICAFGQVTIGKGCLIGANVTITDGDFHPVDKTQRRYLPAPAHQRADAVVIGDDVFIGTGACILPGTRIGAHAVVGANAVVKGTVATGSVVAGNPARFIRAIRSIPEGGGACCEQSEHD